jgi:hypothetical protein
MGLGKNDEKWNEFVIQQEVIRLTYCSFLYVFVLFSDSQLLVPVDYCKVLGFLW